QLMISVDNAPQGALLQVQMFGVNGTLVNQFTTRNGDPIPNTVAPGLYFCHVYIGEDPIGVAKCIIIP
ncbi:MAG: hypothetical protein L6Q97_27115, partial [Thermoanaerobaculia bacterium]|nr:hypothetical protein [Thermoanaerobaculia bacterium]